MKILWKLMIICILISFIVSCGPKAAEAPAAEAPAAEAPLSPDEQWLKDNQLGPYFTLDQDWAAIEEAAKKEGKVVVYSSSSRIEDQIEIWNQVYPDIVLEGYDMDDISTKMVEEQNAGNVVGDVWFNSEGELLLPEIYPDGQILPFIPSEFADALTTSEEQPFAIQRYGGDAWAYNIEQHTDGCPVTNWWQIVNGTWTENIYVEDPLASADGIAFYVNVTDHGDEFAAAYQDEMGKDWTTDPDYGDDTPNAGWLWVKKFAKTPNLVLMPGGDEVVEAVASLGMTQPAGIAMTSYSKVRDTIKGEVALGICNGLEPAVGTTNMTFLGIARNAPHPNAAKLYVRFGLTVEGREPWNVLGNWPGRSDIDPPEGAPPFSEASLWPQNDISVYEQASFVRDFWTLNALAP